MKRIAYSLMMLVVATFIFTSCEDVPSPFGTVTPPNTSTDSDETTEIKGTGTVSDPFNIAAIIAQCNKLASGEVSEQAYYFKGKVSAIAVDKSGNAQNFNYGTYGNASFYISDDGTTTNQFYCYRVLYLGNKKWTEGAGESLKVGDDVIVCAKLTNYNGTLETQQNEGYLYSLNGKTEGGGGGDTPSGDAKGTGTLEDPFNAASATNEALKLASGTVSDKAYYIKGKVAEIAVDKNGNVQNFDYGTYGNASFYVSDDGTTTNKFYCYRVLYLGNKKWATGSGDVLKVGDDVVVCAKLTNYNGTPETQQNEGYLYSLNGKTEGGGGGDVTPGQPQGDGSEGNPFNVAAAIAKCKDAGETATTQSYYIKGITDNDYTISSYKNFEANIVDSEGSSETFKVFRVKDKDGKDLKEGWKIAKGSTIIVYGPVVNYKGNTPETATGAYLVSVNGKDPELNDGTGGGDTPGGGSDTPSTLTNGGFETWANGIPTGWKSASTASSATLAQSTDAHTGSYSCNVKGDASANKRLASQEITLAAGTYNFSFWVKPTTSNAAQVRPGYVPIGADGKAGSYAYGDYATLTAGWQQVSYDFTLDAETIVCLVVMNPKKSSYSSGEDVLIDDATLTKK